ncbi:MAG: YggT family protein [Candidatus Binatia bacterium]
MFILGNFLAGLGQILGLLVRAYMWIIIIRALISWVSPDPYNPIVRFLQAATDPVLYRIRRLIPVNFGGIDFSPIIAIAVLLFLEAFLVQSLFDLSRQLR